MFHWAKSYRFHPSIVIKKKSHIELSRHSTGFESSKRNDRVRKLNNIKTKAMNAADTITKKKALSLSHKMEIILQSNLNLRQTRSRTRKRVYCCKPLAGEHSVKNFSSVEHNALGSVNFRGLYAVFQAVRRQRRVNAVNDREILRNIEESKALASLSSSSVCSKPFVCSSAIFLLSRQIFGWIRPQVWREVVSMACLACQVWFPLNGSFQRNHHALDLWCITLEWEGISEGLECCALCTLKIIDISQF